MKNDPRPVVRWMFRLWYWPVSDPSVSKRSPDAFFLFLASISSGTYQLTADQLAPSISTQLAGAAGTAWATFLILYGVLGLVAIFWSTKTLHAQITGLLIERIARSTIGLFTMIYAVVIIKQNGLDTAAYPAAVITALGLSSLFRVAHITMWLLQVRRFHNA